MNYKLRLFVTEMLGILQGFLVSYCIITVFLYQTNTSAPLYSLGLIPIPFLSRLIERKAKHIWSFVLLHCAILPIYLLTSYSLDSAVIFSIYILLTTVTAYYTKNTHSQSNIYYMIIVFLIFYIGTTASRMQALSQLIFSLAILFTLLHFLRLYLYNFTKYFQAHSSVANIPYRQIRNSNHALVIFLGLLCFSVVLIPFGLPLNAFLLQCIKGVLQLFYFLVSLFMRDDSGIGQASFSKSAEGLTPAKTSPLIQLIFKILEWGILILFVAAVLFVITWSIYKIYQYFYRKNRKEITDRVEFISPFTKKEASKKAPSLYGNKRFGRSGNGAIRKCFYQAVCSSVQDSTQIQKDLIPADLTGLIKTPNLGDAPNSSLEQRQLITRTYEKARYSNLECTKEEVKQMKQLLK